MTVLEALISLSLLLISVGIPAIFLSPSPRRRCKEVVVKQQAWECGTR